jgi:hypothetical protein
MRMRKNLPEHLSAAATSLATDTPVLPRLLHERDIQTEPEPEPEMPEEDESGAEQFLEAVQEPVPQTPTPPPPPPKPEPPKPREPSFRLKQRSSVHMIDLSDKIPDKERPIMEEVRDRIEANPDVIRRGREGQLVIDGKMVPKTTFDHLLHSLYRKGVSKYNMTGLSEFKEALSRIGLDDILEHYHQQTGRGIRSPGREPKILRIYR